MKPKELNRYRMNKSRFWLSLLVSTTFIINSQAQDAVEEKSPWEKSASAGLTLTGGNADTVLFTANILATRKKGQNELSLGMNGAYGENGSTTINQSIEGFSQYNRLFSDHTFGYLRTQAIHDGIADVDYRLTIGPGGGHYFIKNDKTNLSAEFGPSFIYEQLGASASQGYLSVRIGETFTHKLSDRARLWQNVEFLPQVDDFNNFLVSGEIGVEADITEKMSLRTFIQDTYRNQPAPGRKSNDIKLVTAIGYKF